jgi:hypothetical protein
MATLVQPSVLPTSEEVTAAEEALCEIFFDHLDSLPFERQREIITDLRTNAVAHGE